VERIFRRISEFEEQGNYGGLFMYFQSCSNMLMTFRKYFPLLQHLLKSFKAEEFTFSQLVPIFQKRSEYLLISMKRLCGSRLLRGRRIIDIYNGDEVTIDFEYVIPEVTVDEINRIDDVAEAYFNILKIIEPPINLYAMNKALTYGRIITNSLVKELKPFISADVPDIYSIVAHSLEKMVESKIIKRIRKGFFVPDFNYDTAVQIFANVISFYEKQWMEYSQRKVGESFNVCGVRIAKNKSISDIIPTILLLLMFLRKHLYYGLRDFPIIVTDNNQPIGYVPFEEVSEAILRTILTGTSDKNLNKKVTKSVYFIRIQPLDPKMTMKEAWLVSIKQPSEYIPLIKDDLLGYMTDEDLRFWPRIL